MTHASWNQSANRTVITQKDPADAKMGMLWTKRRGNVRPVLKIKSTMDGNAPVTSDTWEMLKENILRKISSSALTTKSMIAHITDACAWKGIFG